MKKAFFLLASTLLAAFLLTACEEDVAKNPGDFNLKSALDIEPYLTSNSGAQFQLTKLREADTTYVYFYTTEDTLRDEKGEFIIDSKGNYIIKVDTIYYNSNITAKLKEYQLVALPAPADTFTLTLKSNAKWKAPEPRVSGVQWFYVMNLAGGGDSNLKFRVSRNRTRNPRPAIFQNIFTEDSTVMVRLSFMQEIESQ